MVYQFEKFRYVEKVEGKLCMGGKNPQGEEIYSNNLYLTPPTVFSTAVIFWSTVPFSP